MAKKRTIFNEGTDPGEDPVEDPVIEEGRKISELPPAPKEADGMATPEIEDGEMAIAASVPDADGGGNLTYKIKLSDVITNAKSEFDEYNVKNILAGTYIDDVTETPVDSGNWTINAEKQRMDPGTFVESLNGVKGDLTLTSTDESIVIEPEEVLNEETEEYEYTGNIDLTLNTTTSSLYRAWIEVTAENFDSGSFDFNDEKLTKDNSVVSINGVVLDGDQYTLSAGVVALLGLDEIPLKPGDVIGVISFVAETPNSAFSNPTYGLLTKDISIVGEDPTGEPVPKAVVQNNLQTQQDVNWFLLREIESLDIPEAIDQDSLVTEDKLAETLDDYATIEWVLDQDYITEQVVTDAVSDQAADQALVDQDQDREIEALETRVSQIESVSLDARYLFEGDAQVPRDGEFTILKAGGSEIAEQWSEAAVLYFAENAVDGSPDWDGVTEDDVIRIGGSSAGIIVPTEIESREADTFAEFRVDSIAAERLFNVSLVRSASQPLAGVEYGVVLLSSFDPSGLATTDFVVSELAKKFDKSGGTITGAVAVEDGNLTVKDKEFRVKTASDENAFRVQPASQAVFNVPTRMNEELDMKDNKIIGCGPADPARGHDVVNVDFLNAAIGTIDTNVGDAELSADNTFTGINTFTKEIKSTNNTVFDFQGDANNPQDRHFKIRRGINMTIYCYSGNNNNDAKKCFHATWARDESNPEVFLNYLRDPTQNGHAVNLRYANSTYLKISDYSPPEASVLPRLSPVVFKCDQFAKGTQAGIPLEGEVCGMYNSAPGSSTAGNPYWGNTNVELRVHVNKLRDESGGEISKGYNKVFAGYVTLVGKDNKIYLKAAIHSVTRDNDKDYVRIHFDNRTKPFGTGSYNSSADGYAVLIEGYDIHG